MSEPYIRAVGAPCPNCHAVGMSVFYEAHNVPVHSVLVLRTREEAVSGPTGDIDLALCPACGFISNVAFDESLHQYSSEYESTQSCSPTFNVFHQTLARNLIERYDLHNKDIIEIGCGQGEFLTMLCEMGGNRGVGFDPAIRTPSAYDSQRPHSEASDAIRLVKDFYSEDYAEYHADFVCCKMTLEHIPNTAEFVSTVHRSLAAWSAGDRTVATADTVVFFQVPDVARILRERAFWDIYYEHCSYFSTGSLARLFRGCGFDVIDLWKDYDDQYLMIGARPSGRQRTPSLLQEDDLEELTRDVALFSESYRHQFDTWRRDLQEIRRDGGRAVLWGGGSKAVAFLTTLDLRDEIEYVVDINPHKHGTYLAGTGQEVVAPDILRQIQPDLVVVMNPVYCEEIQADLTRMGLSSKLMTV